MRRFRLVLIIGILLLPLCGGEEEKDGEGFVRKVSFSHEEAERDFFIVKRPAYSCVKIETGPVIDGKLDDGCWKKLPRLTEFYSGAGKGLTSRRTIGWFCHDDTNLYVAALCMEPDPGGMRMTINEPGGQVWMDEDVEVFINPESLAKGTKQYIANPQGTPYQNFKPSAWKVKTSIGKDRWIFEAAIPFDELKKKPEGNWKFNLTRGMPQRDEYAGWAGLIGSWHQPDKFATLTFGPAPEVWITEVDLGSLTEGRNILEAQVRNMSGAAIKADLTLQVKSEEGGLQAFKQTAELKPGSRIPFSLDYEYKAPGKHTLSLMAAESKTGKILWTETYRAEVQSLASMLVAKRCYPGRGETGAVIKLGFGNSEHLRAGAIEMSLEQKDKVLRKGRIAGLKGNTVNLMVDISGLKPGIYSLRARIIQGEKELGNRIGEFEILANPFTWRDP